MDGWPSVVSKRSWMDGVVRRRVDDPRSVVLVVVVVVLVVVVFVVVVFVVVVVVVVVVIVRSRTATRMRPGQQQTPTLLRCRS